MQHRRLRAPREHGQRLIDPPLASAASLVAANRSIAAETDFQGRSLASLAAVARRDLWSAARDYTRAYRTVAPTNIAADTPLVMTGHQPSLFHPGVWFKNFALDHLAKKLDARAVNVLIDNDVASHSAIRIPTGSASKPRAVSVPYDSPQPGLPFEECRLLDPSLFASFDRRVAETIRPFCSSPLIGRMWPRARQAAGRTDRAYQCIAEARHCLEQDWGLDTLEVPLSEICRQPAFRWFASYVLAHAPRFLADHNSALAQYRRINRVRSKTHPVPELARDDGWWETPFWIWSEEDPRRRPLFVRPRGDHTDLSDLGAVTLRHAPLHADRSAEAAVAYFADQERQGIKIRPRALMTTMFCRLFLSDLFIHGIGGAKYDQLTDELMARFLGQSPPGFLVATATAHLPIQREPVDRGDLQELYQLERELRFHPERHLEKTPATQSLIQEKQRWIYDGGSDRRQRHRAISRLNQAMADFLGAKRQETTERIARTVAALARERILASREYSFCLFSEPTLQALLLDI